MQRRHPWVFDGAIAKGSGDAGETVKVESHDGRFLAWAAFSPSSKIRARVWSFDEAQRIDAAFFSARIAAALKARTLFDIQSNGLRLVHGESDGLPGLVVDRSAIRHRVAPVRVVAGFRGDFGGNKPRVLR